jgi:hypothetical protein
VSLTTHLLLLPIPARDVEGLSGDPAGLARRQEDGGRPDVLRLTDPAQRRLRLELFAVVTVVSGNSGERRAFGLDYAGIDRADADLAQSQPLGWQVNDATVIRLIELTRTLRSPNSLASDRVTASTAALVAL